MVYTCLFHFCFLHMNWAHWKAALAVLSIIVSFLPRIMLDT